MVVSLKVTRLSTLYCWAYCSPPLKRGSGVSPQNIFLNSTLLYLGEFQWILRVQEQTFPSSSFPSPKTGVWDIIPDFQKNSALL